MLDQPHQQLWQLRAWAGISISGFCIDELAAGYMKAGKRVRGFSDHLLITLYYDGGGRFRQEEARLRCCSIT